MINLHTKFEVPTFTDYEDIKGNENCSIKFVRVGKRMVVML